MLEDCCASFMGTHGAGFLDHGTGTASCLDLVQEAFRLAVPKLVALALNFCVKMFGFGNGVAVPAVHNEITCWAEGKGQNESSV